jgi:hypothetical protein
MGQGQAGARADQRLKLSTSQGGKHLRAAAGAPWHIVDAEVQPTGWEKGNAHQDDWLGSGRDAVNALCHQRERRSDDQGDLLFGPTQPVHARLSQDCQAISEPDARRVHECLRPAAQHLQQHRLLQLGVDTRRVLRGVSISKWTTCPRGKNWPSKAGSGMSPPTPLTGSSQCHTQAALLGLNCGPHSPYMNLAWGNLRGAQ